MSIFPNLGNHQPHFKNQFKNSEQGKISNSFTHEQASNIYNNSLKNSRFCGGWLKALDRRDIRTATKNKVPQRKNWPNIYEKLRAEELLRKYSEWGARTGKRVGNKWYVIADLDLKNFTKTLWQQLEKNFLLMKTRQRIKHIKTKRGYHDIFLLDELPSNGAIYHTDKFGVRRKIGDILAVGRQAQALGSMDKEEAGEGKWAWQAKNIQEISEIWKKYFLEIECQEQSQRKQKLESNLVKLQQEIEQKQVSTDISESQKPSKNLYKLFKLENIRITSKQPTKRVNHYRVNYLDKWQNKGWFFLDSYFRDKKELIQPNLFGSFLLMRGYKYQFFAGFG